jgi:hypothetical protein
VAPIDNIQSHYVRSFFISQVNMLLTYPAGFNMLFFVGFEVLTADVMNSSIFWDITRCSPFKVNRHFGGTCCLHLHGRRKSQARNQREASTTQRYIPEDRTLKVVIYSQMLNIVLSSLHSYLDSTVSKNVVAVGIQI